MRKLILVAVLILCMGATYVDGVRTDVVGSSDLGFTVGSGEVYTQTANDNINPNGGTGTLGQSDDYWDGVYSEKFSVGAATLEKSGDNIVLSNTTTSSTLAFSTSSRPSGGSIGSSSAGILLFASQAGGGNETGTVRITSRKGNGTASTGALRLSNDITLATAGDLLCTFENPTGTVRASVDKYGAISSNGNIQALTSSSIDTTLGINDHTLLADASTVESVQTVTLPDAATVTGSVFSIKKTDSSTIYVTIDPAGADTIDGETTISLISQMQFINVQSDGTNYYILSQRMGDCASDYLDSNQTTTSGTFEAVTGLSATVTLQTAGVIRAQLSFTCASSTGSTSIVGIAIEIDSVDRGEVHRYLSAGGADTGTGSAIARAALSSGTYTVKARFRLVSGSGVPQLNANLCHLTVQACVQ